MSAREPDGPGDRESRYDDEALAPSSSGPADRVRRAAEAAGRAMGSSDEATRLGQRLGMTNEPSAAEATAGSTLPAAGDVPVAGGLAGGVEGTSGRGDEATDGDHRVMESRTPDVQPDDVDLHELAPVDL